MKQREAGDASNLVGHGALVATSQIFTGEGVGGETEMKSMDKDTMENETPPTDVNTGNPPKQKFRKDQFVAKLYDALDRENTHHAVNPLEPNHP